jgi:hypothetical protein
VIMENVISLLMRSNFSRLTYPKLLFHTKCAIKLLRLLLSGGYGNQISLAQSDPIKRCPS